MYLLAAPLLLRLVPFPELGVAPLVDTLDFVSRATGGVEFLVDFVEGGFGEDGDEEEDDDEADDLGVFVVAAVLAFLVGERRVEGVEGREGWGWGEICHVGEGERKKFD